MYVNLLIPYWVDSIIFDTKKDVKFPLHLFIVDIL